MSASASPASAVAVLAAWAAAVGARAGTALVGGAGVLQEATATTLQPMPGPGLLPVFFWRMMRKENESVLPLSMRMVQILPGFNCQLSMC